MKLSLCIIAKDQVSECAGIINRYANEFDEIVIVGDDKHDEFGSLTGILHGEERDTTIKYFPYKWIGDFADKRNFAASKVTSDYYLRLDTDDEIKGLANVRKVALKAKDNYVDAVYCKYIYFTDKDGNVGAEHWRETIIKKRDGLYWKKPVHECLFWDDVKSATTVKDDSIVIKHMIDEAHIASSNERNLSILVNEYNKDKENCDPRTIGYIGRSFLGMGQWEMAIRFLTRLVEKSGWEEDRYFAYCQLSEALLRLGKFKEAVGCAFDAIQLNSDYPDAYLKLGQIYLDKNEFKTALHWYMVGLNKPLPETTLVIDPSFYGWITQLNVALCYLGLGDTENAIQYYNIATKSSPNADGIIATREMFATAYQNDKAFFHIKSLCKLYDTIDPKKSIEVVKSIPKELMVDERASVLKKKYLPPQTHHDRSVVFFCGGAYEDWADPSVQMGIGGSEEAVVYMSRELVKLGYYVTVYNQCGDLAGNWNGVEYINWYEFNPNDNFDTLIMWRGVPFNCKANRRFVWLHDVPFDTINSHNISWFDKVFVLSQFHKQLLPSCVPEEKIFVTSNGINLEDVSKVERQPKRCIYTSSYDRGLENLLDIWADVKKEVPEAELHIFYGWNTYDKMVKMGMRDGKFKDHLLPKLAQYGVFEHGRIGQEQLAEELAKSDLFTYPCQFEEISCISAMKAQAFGAIPVVTSYAALTETVKDGFMPDLEHYKDVLIKTLKQDNEEVRKTMLADREKWSWAKVADQWDTILK